MFSLINRGRYTQAIEEEFESLFARLRGLLSQTFDTDGNLIVADPNLAVFDVGDIKPSFRPTDQIQDGWLLCDGSQVSRVTYASLFSVIGTTHGVGDGSTTFNLPDMRGRFPLGVAASGTGSTLGATGGSIDHTHSMTSASVSAAGDHSHGGGTGGAGGHTHSGTGSTSSDGGHTHTYSDTTSGPSADVSIDGNEQNSLVASNSHTHEVSGETSSAGSHNHSVTITTSEVTDHTHNIGNSGNHTHTVSGSTDAANPPFNAVNYYIFTGIA